MTSPLGSRRLGLAASLALLALAPLAQGSTISFHTRALLGTPTLNSANDARTLAEALTAVAPTTGYCDAAPAAWDGLSNQTVCLGSRNDIAFDIGAMFEVAPAQAGTWSFRVGPDFGLGGALFIDGVAVDFRNSDMWWNGTYADPTQILTASVALGAGVHEIEAYGFERCCDGAQQAQFLAPQARTYVTFGAGDGQTPGTVPEAPTLPLALAACAGLLLARRSRA